MSLILDALNKADKENHQPESSPSIDTEHELPEDLEPLHSSKMKRILVSIAMFLIIAVLIWSIFLRPQNESSTNKTALAQNDSSSIKQQRNPQEESLRKKTASNARASTPSSSKSAKNSRKKELQNRLIEAQYKEEQERLRLEAQPQADKALSGKQDIEGLYKEKTSDAAKIATDTQTVANQTVKSRSAQKDILGNAENDEASRLLNEARVELMRIEALENNPNERINQVINDELAAIAKEKTASEAPKAAQVIKAPNSATPVATKPESTKTETKQAGNDDDTTLAFYKDIGSIRELPISAQEAIPTMMYTQHNYSKGQKSIEINGKKIRENGRIGSDVKVDKILKDGAIMRYKKYTFKMSAYNNWINF